MRAILFCLIMLAAAPFVAAQSIEKEFPTAFTLKVKNPLDAARQDVLVVVSPDQLKQIKGFNPKAFVVMDGKAEIASQYNTADRTPGVVFVIAKLAAGESKDITVRFHPSATKPRTYEKKTQAELSYKTGGEWKNREYIGGAFQNTTYLRVPKEHKDHSWFIRYEGPGWESDKVGYRFYLDQRNATDVFGKTTPKPVLQLVGQDGFDSYHNMQPWGMDVMKVGKSLGIGSIGAMLKGSAIRVEKTDSVNCTITENGVTYASILTRYFGWQIGSGKYNVESLISIHAGTRLTHQQLLITGNPDSLCTGIVKDKAAELLKSTGDGKSWGYIATYGKQSLNNDDLGLVIFFNAANVVTLTADEFSNIVVLKPAGGKLDYYFAGAWALEQNGIDSREKFIHYIESTARELGAPLQVSVKK